MPYLDGLELTTLIRERDPLAAIPILVLVASGSAEEWRQLAARGADQLLMKPGALDDIVSLVRRPLSLSALLPCGASKRSPCHGSARGGPHVEEAVASRLTKAFSDDADHAGYVDAWLDGAAKTQAPAQLITLFERALGALWQRTEGTLGEVTLTAIVDRVLYTASEQYPFIATLTVERTGISFEGLRSQGAHDTNLREALRLVLVEFLTVLGHLTDEILTPALHAELSGVALEGPRAVGGNDDGAPGARS